MSQTHIEGLREGLDAFNRTGEINIDHLAPDFEMHQAAFVIDTAGVFRGRDALQQSLGELQGAFEGLRFEAEKFIEAPAGEIVVFIRVRGRGVGSGVEIDNRIAWVWTFRGEDAIRLMVYEEQTEALEAVGLRE
jgi:ketosteroid isomerase-like protein